MALSDLFVWDPLRWVLIIEGILTGAVCGPCIAWSHDAAQRFRFLSLMTYGLITTALMMLGLGRGYDWYHWALAVNGLVAFLAQTHFVLKNALAVIKGRTVDREGKWARR